jgi:transposase
VCGECRAGDEDTVRDVIHRFDEIGLACLDPRWGAGGRPRLLDRDDEDFVVQTATTRPTSQAAPRTATLSTPWCIAVSQDLLIGLTAELEKQSWMFQAANRA